jgi:hypothetical protein
VEWYASKFSGEQNRTAQGCIVGAGSEYVCVFVRCDEDKSISLHFSAPGPDINGNVSLVIDGKSFALSVPDSPPSPLPLASRAESMPAGLLEAMKSGRWMIIEGAGLKPEYKRISLAYARIAIKAVEHECGINNHSKN